MLKVLVFLAVANLAAAQGDPRHTIEVGMGAGIPVFSRSRMMWDDSPLLSAGYGFRWTRHFQTDLMYTHVFRPAETRFEPFQFVEGHSVGGGSIRSFLLGGRVLFPGSGRRILLSAGAGAIHERFNAPHLTGVIDLDQSATGAYVLASAAAALGNSNRFHIGVTPRFEVIQASNAVFHRNRWLTLLIQFGVRL